MDLTGYYDITETPWFVSPTSTSNQAGTIQTALTDVAGYGGGVLYFPPGTYCVDASVGPALTVSGTGVEIRGAGIGASTIKDISTTTTAYPFPIITAHNADSIKIRNIGFLGNDTSTSPTAPTDENGLALVSFYSGGSRFKIKDCYFTKNRSYTIYMRGVTDAQVSKTYFEDVGYNDNGAHSGPLYRTDAIFYDTTCELVRANHNSLHKCNYGGIKFDCHRGDASNNRMSKVYSTSVWSKVDSGDIRVGANNSLMGCAIPMQGGTPIYSDVGVQAISTLGNVVTYTDDDGFSIAGPVDAVVFANLSIYSNQKTGDSGLQINPQFSTLSQGVTVVGNNVNQGGKGKKAIKIFIDPAAAPTHPYILYSTLMGNVLYNSVNSPSNDQIEYDKSPDNEMPPAHYYALQDDSNTVIGNAFWLERQHTLTPTPANSSSSYTTLLAAPVNSNTMLERGGIRVTAVGSVTGGISTRYFNVGFGPSTTSATNIFSAQAWTPATSSDTWQLIVVVMNNNEAGAPRDQQSVLVQLYAGGSLQITKTVDLSAALAIDTSVQNFIYVQAKNGASSQSVYLDDAVTERC